MKKLNLNEEIYRIRKLLLVNESSVIEESNPIGNIVKKFAPSLEKKFIADIEAKLGKSIAQATDVEIETILKSSSMSALRKDIAKAVYASEKQMIDNVFSKYDMNNIKSAGQAYKELQQNGLNSSILRDIKFEWSASKSSGASVGSTGAKNAFSGIKNLFQNILGSSKNNVNNFITFLEDPKTKINIQNEISTNINDPILVKKYLGQVDNAINQVKKISTIASEEEAVEMVIKQIQVSSSVSGAELMAIKKQLGDLIKSPTTRKVVFNILKWGLGVEIVNQVLKTDYTLLGIINNALKGSGIKELPGIIKDNLPKSNQDNQKPATQEPEKRKADW